MSSNFIFKCKKNAAIVISSSRKLSDKSLIDMIKERKVKVMNIEGNLRYIGDGLFEYSSTLREVCLPESLKIVGINAFNKCVNLKEINFPDKLVTIDDGAFSYCEALKEVVFGNNLKYLGEYAFRSTCNLDKVVINSSKTIIQNNCFVYSGVKCVELNDNIKEICNGAFDSCSKLSNIKLPSNLRKLGVSAFRYCSSLKDIEIPSKIKHLQEYTFEYCFSLNNVVLHDGLKSIERSAFRGCSSIEEIELPDSVEFVGHSCFYNCTNLKKIKLSEGLRVIGPSAFEGCASLEEIIIPKSVQEIGSNAFKGCTSLKKVTILGNVSGLANSMFSDCKSLDTIVIPDSVNVIGDLTFAGCSSLKTIALPPKLERVGTSCFAFSGLEKLDIPDSVIVIGDCAFESCNKLKEISISNNIEHLCNYVFKGCSSLERIDIPENVNSIGNNFFMGCTNLKEVNIPKNVESFGKHVFKECSSLEYLPLPSVTTCIEEGMFKGCNSLKEIIIPENVNVIKKDAFCDCANLVKITFNDKLFKIDKCFRGCNNLQQIILPDSLVDVDDGIFAKCKGLKEVVFGKNIKKIGQYAFKNCDQLEKITFNENLEEIKLDAFSCCSKLREIVIPNSVKKIGDKAFFNCVSLDRVVVPLFMDSFASSAFEGCSKVEIVFGDGKRYKYDDIFFLEDVDKNVFFYDRRNLKYVFYREGKCYEIENEKDLKKLNNAKNISSKYYSRLYFWNNNKFLPHSIVIENFPIRDMNMFYINGNCKKWAEIVNYSYYSSNESLCALLKICYVLGVFQMSSKKRDEAVEFIKNSIIDVNNETSIHIDYDGFDINNGYDPMWAEFFMKYYGKEFQLYDFEKEDFFVSSYNNFALVKKAYPNKLVNTNRISELLSIDEVAGVIRCMEYDGVDKDNEVFASTVAMYSYSENSFLTLQKWFNQAKKIKDKDLKIFISDDIVDENRITYELLEKDNPLGAVLGNITNCCQTINGMGQSCVQYGMTMPNSKFMTFNIGKQVIGQAWVWYDEKSGIVCLDNIEVPKKFMDKIKGDREIRKSFLQCLDRMANSFIKDMENHNLIVRKVTIGQGYNDIKSILQGRYLLNIKGHCLSNYDGYTDAKKQYVIKNNR